MKQETLEEAAENYIKSGLRYHFTFGSWIIGVKKGFIEGAKSDAARDYWFEQFKKK